MYQDVATKFFEHFLHIVEAMNNVGDEGIGLWNDQSVLWQLLDALRVAYQRFAYALSLPT